MQYVALLRAITPGNPNMRNDNLRRVLEDLGFRDVRTVIASGNVLFEADPHDAGALEACIEEAWPARLGFESTTIIRSGEQIRQLVAAEPFDGREDAPASRLHVTFLKDEPADDVGVPAPADDAGFGIVAVRERAVFSVIDLSGARTPDLMRWLERCYGKRITTRTWKTVHRIAAKLT